MTIGFGTVGDCYLCVRTQFATLLLHSTSAVIQNYPVPSEHMLRKSPMNNNKREPVLAITCLGLLAGCGGGQSTEPTFAVGVTVSGLAGTLVLKDNFSEQASLNNSASNSASSRSPSSASASVQNLSVTADGTYSF